MGMSIPRREEGNVLVCTDAAARGLDIPAVSHIVQADFASTAIDFLHRVIAAHLALEQWAPGNLILMVSCFAKYRQNLRSWLSLKCTG